ncbi:hypothetical protein AMD24_00172 [Candidatus Xiphinematobacter sp. Idaho Grape]|nr:hypothetical protein AMD24_00172 [Candidatus Xiphinematobacter sp. Idaho Grape]
MAEGHLSLAKRILLETGRGNIRLLKIARLDLHLQW